MLLMNKNVTVLTGPGSRIHILRRRIPFYVRLKDDASGATLFLGCLIQKRAFIIFFFFTV